MTMDSKFDPAKVEQEIYKKWEESGAFGPSEGKKPYTVLMPPPNANASLHAGHGMYTIDDILIRYHRMKGEAAQWIPGRDHAGFETQFVYEKQLAKEGKSRLDFDRETLYQNVAKFVEDNSGLIFEQFRRLGFSADWSRSVFTLDPHVLSRVFETFKKMADDKLVYRSDYLVQYCPFCGTSLAELEILHDEREDKLYYIKYGDITVATVRPETMFGDSAVMVNPEDRRYAKLIGTMVKLPLTSRMIPVIADQMADMEFGTGVVKITPAHDSNDFEAGKRHNLPVIRVINQMGRMTLPKDALTPEIDGMKVRAAREKTVELLQAAGVLEKIDEHYLHAVTVCYKCKRDMEPMTVPNWYIKVDPLKPAVIKAVEEKKTKFFPQKFEKQMLDWMAVMHDWPISRQVAWGIRIPAWYKTSEASNQKIYVTFLNKEKKNISGEIGELLKEYGLEDIKAGLQTLSAPSEAIYEVSETAPGEDYLQETDTFDTWFSSGQWPLVTLRDDEYSRQYPTDVMATMSDILKFWVSRMMMFGLYIRGEVPFKNVYLWSTVTDGKGQKMSKSKGNVINPIDLVDKYGADAFRMALLFGNGEGGKIPLSEDKVRAMRNFGNKIWNMSRFYMMMADPTSPEATLGAREIPWYEPEMKGLSKDDQEILEQLNTTTKKMTTLLDKFRFSEAADTIYEFLWHTVADVYIEQVKVKDDKGASLAVLRHVLLTGLKLLHPFMPFVTEAIWSEMPRKYDKMLVVSKWPEAK